MQIPNDYNGVTVFQGFSSSYGDLGKATIDGGTSGSSYILLQIVNCLSISFLDLVFQNNGATGTESGVRNGDGGNSSITTFTRCVFKGMKGSGVFAHAGGNFIECEAYDNVGIGFELRSAVYCRRCISHDNGSHGFSSAGFATKAVLESCASFKNGGSGIGYSDNSGLFSLRACDFYDNVSHGVDGSVQNFVLLENCNFVKNGGYGLQVNSANAIVFLSNCGFGSGTQANTSGTTNIPVTSVVEEIATVTYASDVTPWANPDEGDFRITLAAAKNAGRGAFTLTDATYDGGTVGYPDIGAVQHEDSGGALLRPVNLNGGLV
jgi:hypothetical protein